MKLKEFRIIMCGLDGAGKTALLYRMKTNELGQTFPTIGFNCETVWKSPKNIVFTIWDVGGHEKVRDLWKYYFEEKEGVIFVVDAGDRARFPIVKHSLRKLMQEPALRGTLLCVVANKSDLGTAMSAQDLYYALDLDSINREKTIIDCSVTENKGVLEILDWFSENLKPKSKKELKEERKQAEKAKKEEAAAAQAKQREVTEKAMKKRQQKAKEAAEDEDNA